MRDPFKASNFYLDQLVEKLDYSSGDDLFDEKIIRPYQEIRLKPEDFLDVYDEEKIEADNQYVEEREKDFDKETKNSIRLAYCIMDGIESYNWFGQDCMLVQTSRYDDIKNGMDFVLCFTQENGPAIKIGVDVTVSEDIETLRRKREATKSRIRRGVSHEIEYFNLDSEDEKKGRITVPRVIIGTNALNSRILFEDFKEALAKKESGEKVEKNQLQHELLQEILSQLGYLIEFSANKLIEHNKTSEDRCLGQLISLLNPLFKMDSIDTELASKEFNELFDFLEAQNEVIFNIDSSRAKIIFQYLEAFKTVRDIVKEKGSASNTLGTQDSTINYLKSKV